MDVSVKEGGMRREVKVRGGISREAKMKRWKTMLPSGTRTPIFFFFFDIAAVEAFFERVVLPAC